MFRFSNYSIWGLGSYNHKAWYPNKRVRYEPIGKWGVAKEMESMYRLSKSKTVGIAGRISSQAASLQCSVAPRRLQSSYAQRMSN